MCNNIKTNPAYVQWQRLRPISGASLQKGPLSLDVMLIKPVQNKLPAKKRDYYESLNSVTSHFRATEGRERGRVRELLASSLREDNEPVSPFNISVSDSSGPVVDHVLSVGV